MSTKSFPGDSNSQAEAAGAATEPPSHVSPREPAEPLGEAAIQTRAPRTVTWARGQLAAWFLLSVVYVVTTAVRAAPAAGGPVTRLLQYAYGAGHFFVLGALSAGVVFVWRRLLPRANAISSALAAAALAFAVGWPLLADDFVNLVSGAKHVLVRRLFRATLVLGVATAIPLAVFLGEYLARKGLRAMGVVLGMLAMTASCFVAPQSYFGLHLTTAIVSATLIGAALRGFAPRHLAVLITGGPRLVGPYTIAFVWGVWSISAHPPAAVLFELFATPGAVLAPFVARLHIDTAPVANDVLSRFFPSYAVPTPNAGHPSPSKPLDKVVVLLTVDCLRADLIANEDYDTQLPNFAKLRDQSVYFTHARTTAPSTVIALSSVFTGKYHSQLRWTDVPTSRGRRSLPTQDPSPRFPQLLSDAGVQTATYAPIDWLSSSGGVTRGFAEEEVLSIESNYAFSEVLVDRIIRRIHEHKGGPLFLFTHVLDAHAPYDLAGESGSSFERYVRELALVDKQIGKLRDALAKDVGAERATLIVTADHGEAFGEHNTTFHKFTAYEELVRVPLMIVTPGATPARVHADVSLLDLGPTILELFGQPPSPEMMGESLGAALHGNKLVARRPKAVESDLHQALIFPDGMKIIFHKQRGTVELYDLSIDRAEEQNLFHEKDHAAVERLGALGAFFKWLPKPAAAAAN